MVFMISNCPEIHSNSYRICFDVSNGQKIGYIRPIWPDTYNTLPDTSFTEVYNTIIRLLLKEDKPVAQIKGYFKEINPYLLLFLNRLKQIEIEFNSYSSTDSRIKEHKYFT
ncbi:unnamed protein product [Didymodactylos carnosus]|uniref:Uncharacterized protein n=1 Tax=Didymodactylos carnosus TaxID=1234261 RepID=A0A816C1S5_9BILA|nr:unnamed protein product [Didymodactylos carnosus]CAF4507320.1 unnamed protein product [Didymodactylos carnosus]